ncbi:hypothetical protein, partial [Methylotuvimicrobium sp.]|uniref:hypothetical protein n=2 Tax=Methylotuvimicrobium sp. TaxID=2822413 RepID=UPI003D6525F6
LFPKLQLGKDTPEAPASCDRHNLRTFSINPDSLVQSFLIVGKLELPKQVTQAGAWVTAYFSFCDYD